ncbi:unnamed protein product, partial [Amoebophrya sp. A120]|eukprot:GSA120T00006194001.1
MAPQSRISGRIEDPLLSFDKTELPEEKTSGATSNKTSAARTPDNLVSADVSSATAGPTPARSLLFMKLFFTAPPLFLLALGFYRGVARHNPYVQYAVLVASESVFGGKKNHGSSSLAADVVVTPPGRDDGETTVSVAVARKPHAQQVLDAETVRSLVGKTKERSTTTANAGARSPAPAGHQQQEDAANLQELYVCQLLVNHTLGVLSASNTGQINHDFFKGSDLRELYNLRLDSHVDTGKKILLQGDHVTKVFSTRSSKFDPDDKTSVITHGETSIEETSASATPSAAAAAQKLASRKNNATTTYTSPTPFVPFGDWIFDLQKLREEIQANKDRFVVVHDFLSPEFLARVTAAYPEVVVNEVLDGEKMKNDKSSPKLKSESVSGAQNIGTEMNNTTTEELVPSEAAESNWFMYSNPLEVKYLNDHFERYQADLKRYFHLLSHPVVAHVFTKLFDFSEALHYDPVIHGGGLHAMPRGGRLNMHLDYEKHPFLKNKQRRLNVIFFLNDEWREEWNGDVQLWSSKRTGSGTPAGGGDAAENKVEDGTTTIGVGVVEAHGKNQEAGEVAEGTNKMLSEAGPDEVTGTRSRSASLSSRTTSTIKNISNPMDKMLTRHYP